MHPEQKNSGRIFFYYPHPSYFHAMPVTHPHITNLLNCIDLEEKEQVKRFSLDQQHTLKSLKAEGLAMHPDYSNP